MTITAMKEKADNFLNMRENVVYRSRAGLWYARANLSGCRDRRWTINTQDKLTKIGVTIEIENFLYGLHFLYLGVVSGDRKDFEKGLISLCQHTGVLQKSGVWIQTQSLKYLYDDKGCDYREGVRYSLHLVDTLLKTMSVNVQNFYKTDKAQIHSCLLDIYDNVK
jgi:hypothetical protein